MKAVVWTRYGPPEGLQLQEVPTPEPGPGQVRIRVRASTVTAGDCEARRLAFPFWIGLPMRFYVGLTRPSRITILGQELAGEIDAVGQDVTGRQVGDRVFGSPGLSFGGYAEYKVMAAAPGSGVLATIPPGISFAEAAALVVGGLEAQHFLRLAHIQPGQEVLINGAGGSIGTIAVQLARHYGATVTAVDSGEKLEMLSELGAAEVIDYTREDFTRRARQYDAVLDVIGKAPYGGSMRALKPGGKLLLANPRLSKVLRGRLAGLTGDKQVFASPAAYRADDLDRLTGLLLAGHLRVVIDRRFPLEQTAEAHRYAETGRKQGNIVIAVAD